MNYSIIIPLYNEEENVKILNNQLLSSIQKIENKAKSIFEIIYVDDGSNDKTFLELKNLVSKKISITIVRHNTNQGQSAAILSGIEISKEENLIFLDGDLQNDPDDLLNFVEEYEKKFDMVVGWRKDRKDNYFLRTLPSIIANQLVRIFTKSNLHDHGCAIKILKKHIIFDDITWGDFHRLLAARVINNGYKVSEIKVNHRERLHGESKYGMGRVFKVLIDLTFLKLFKSKKDSGIYFFGLFGIVSFFLSLVTTILMCYLRLVENISFISTPLPLLVIFFTLCGVIFFFFSLLTQLISEQNLSNNKEGKKLEIVRLSEK